MPTSAPPDGGSILRQSGTPDAPADQPKMRVTDHSATVELLTIDALRRQVLGCSERKAREMIREDWFPRPIELGPRCFRWVRSEVLAALAARAPRRAEPSPEPVTLAESRRARIEAMKRAGREAVPA